MSYNPVKNVDFNSLPNYAIANVPILTYALLGITTLTLGYITIKDKESENSNNEETTPPVTAIATEVSPSPATTPIEKGGRKSKSKKSKTQRSKKR